MWLLDWFGSLVGLSTLWSAIFFGIMSIIFLREGEGTMTKKISWEFSKTFLWYTIRISIYRYANNFPAVQAYLRHITPGSDSRLMSLCGSECTYPMIPRLRITDRAPVQSARTCRSPQTNWTEAAICHAAQGCTGWTMLGWTSPNGHLEARGRVFVPLCRNAHIHLSYTTHVLCLYGLIFLLYCI